MSLRWKIRLNFIKFQFSQKFNQKIKYSMTWKLFNSWNLKATSKEKKTSQSEISWKRNHNNIFHIFYKHCSRLFWVLNEPNRLFSFHIIINFPSNKLNTSWLKKNEKEENCWHVITENWRRTRTCFASEKKEKNVTIEHQFFYPLCVQLHSPLLSLMFNRLCNIIRWNFLFIDERENTLEFIILIFPCHWETIDAIQLLIISIYLIFNRK